MKKKLAVILLIVLVLVAVLGVLRWLGLKQELEKEEVDLTYYQSLLDKERDLENIVASRLNQKGLTATTSDKSYTRYQVSNLKVNEEVSEATVRQYATDIFRILKPYETVRPNEAEVMVAALNNQNQSQLAPIQKTINMHKLAVTELLELSVPKDAQLVHVRLVNSLSQVIPLLENMANVFNDPAHGLESGQEYLKRASGFFWATENINVYFFNHNLIFPKEASLNLYFNLD